MTEGNKKKGTEKLIEEMPLLSGDQSEVVTRVYEVFKGLNKDEQDEVLRRIFAEDGPGRLMTVAEDMSTPGALDLILDRISYYHFLPSVVEKEKQ